MTTYGVAARTRGLGAGNGAACPVPGTASDKTLVVWLRLMVTTAPRPLAFALWTPLHADALNRGGNGGDRTRQRELRGWDEQRADRAVSKELGDDSVGKGWISEHERVERV